MSVSTQPKKLTKAEKRSTKRLMADFRKLQKSTIDYIMACPKSKTDMYSWYGIIFGTEETPWEGGTFELDMKFPVEYPMKPPKIVFTTPIFHPNISWNFEQESKHNGEICLDVLKHNWSPTLSVESILMSISSLLNDPNPKSPLNVDAAKLYLENRKEYDKKIYETVEQTYKMEELSDDDESDEEDDVKTNVERDDKQESEGSEFECLTEDSEEEMTES